MSDPRTAPYGSVRLADVDTLAQVDPGNPDINDGAFHLVRRHFDVQAFGVNAATGNAGDEMIEEHHEADDEENRTNGHQELFAVMTGHAVFTVDGEQIDARPEPSSSCAIRRCSAPPGQPPTARRSSWSEHPPASRTRSRAGKHRSRRRAAPMGAACHTWRRGAHDRVPCRSDAIVRSVTVPFAAPLPVTASSPDAPARRRYAPPRWRSDSREHPRSGVRR
jgi:hypothetical protein